MRALLRVACAAALLACSDASPAPVAVIPQRRPVPAIPAPHGDSVQTYSRVDARPVPERIADLVARGLAHVALPADGYSLAHDAVSPSLIINSDRSAKLWYVRAGGQGCSAAASTVALRTAQPDSGQRFEQADWSAPSPVDMVIPNYVIWHLDVTALPNDRGYVALVVDRKSTR